MPEKILEVKLVIREDDIEDMTSELAKYAEMSGLSILSYGVARDMNDTEKQLAEDLGIIS